MAQVIFHSGVIKLDLPENKLSVRVESPGEQYMNAAYTLLKDIRDHLAAYGELPNVEDVAYQLKELSRWKR